MKQGAVRVSDFIKHQWDAARVMLHRFSDKKGDLAVNSWGTRTIVFLKYVVDITRATIRRFSDEEGMHLAAGIAYYALLSIFPLIILFISLFSYFMNAEEIIKWVILRFGSETSLTLGFLDDAIIGSAANRGASGILGILGTLFSSTLIFAAIMRSINRAWGLMGTGNRSIWRRKLWEIILLAGVSSLFILSFTAANFLGVVGKESIPGTGLTFSTFENFIFAFVPFVATSGVFLLLYKTIPTTKVYWRDIWCPSLLAAAAIMIANALLRWYMRHITYYDTLYGPLAHVIVLLLWVYMCANILIIGAALCSVLADFRNKSALGEGEAESLNTGKE